MSKIAFFMSIPGRQRVFTDEHMACLAKLGDLHVYDREDYLDRDYILSFVKGAELIITTWQSPAIDKEILDVCPDLRAVIHAAGSVKPVVTPELIEKGIRVTSAVSEISKGVAETTLGVAIAACKGTYFLPGVMRNGGWTERNNETKDFYDIKIGVIGAGYAGRHFIKLLHNFEVDVFVYDPTLTHEEVKEQLGAEKLELAELMSICDVISIHAPSIPETDKMINADNLPLVKDGAILINTARGSLIDESALVEECKKKRFTVVLDVYLPEPPAVDSPLRRMENIIPLPHIAGVETTGLFRVGKHVCREAERFFAGEKFINELDLAKLSQMA